MPLGGVAWSESGDGPMSTFFEQRSVSGTLLGLDLGLWFVFGR